MSPEEPSARANPPAPREPSGSVYDFHGLYRVRVRHRALDVLMREELPMFLSTGDAVDLTVEEGRVRRPQTKLDDRYCYDEDAFVEVTPSGLVQVEKDRVVAESRVDAWELLGQWVENIMKSAIVRRGACLVHASAVSSGAAGYLFPAWMGTGKTHILLDALRRGYRYMADDWCFVSETGEIFGYPRWLHLYDYHFRAHPELRALLMGGARGTHLRRRFALTEFAESLRSSSSLPRRVRQVLKDRFFVVARAGVDRIVPGAKTVLRSPLSRVTLLISTDRSGVEERPIAPEELATRTVLSGAFERSRHAALRLAMTYAGREVPTSDVAREESEILSRVFRRAECLELALPGKMGPQDLDRILPALASS